MPTECVRVLHIILIIISDVFLNIINRLVFAGETECVSYEVRTKFLYII
jgi:hypothetical protein